MCSDPVCPAVSCDIRAAKSILPISPTPAKYQPPALTEIIHLTSPGYATGPCLAIAPMLFVASTLCSSCLLTLWAEMVPFVRLPRGKVVLELSSEILSVSGKSRSPVKWKKASWTPVHVSEWRRQLGRATRRLIPGVTPEKPRLRGATTH